ncbi:TatD family deoxyribonuclease [Flavobacterium sp. TP390]|uniref:TatD family deoxyribonuclease n=1 Tax=Flavobacterium profundi TaxID=1774945 RepID=A0A6I4IVE0_9FLAO|nr:TatD family hydrolase [Flavobacterium profundi]MVO10887.1 TatD family deoxyribonuclease [Flavobacterium profundi]
MQFINLHTHSFTNDTSVYEVVNQYPWEFQESIPNYSIGIHPWYIDENRIETDLACIEEKLASASCIALGECGLDKRIEIPLEKQLEVFKDQLALVQKTNKPVILHCVAAYQEVIAVKKEMNIQNPMIIHGFSKNEQVAQSLLDNGFYLSFGKYLLRNPELESVFQKVPMDRFFLETDTIEETIAQVYEKASEMKNIPINELKQIVKNNFEATFKREF